jgi:2'-5' RNA ligase
MNWYKIANKKCVFVAAWMPPSFYEKYKHIQNLNENLHMTLLYIVDFEDEDGDREAILRAIKKITSNTSPVNYHLTKDQVASEG